MDKVIGIDFGTTRSIAAVMADGKPAVVPCPEGYCFTPSVVAFGKNHAPVIGLKAGNQALLNPENTISSIRRILGRKFSDPEIQKFLQYLPYQVTRADNDEIRIVCVDGEYTPEEIAALILGKLKTDAEAYLGERITNAVIAIPSYSNNAQRNSIIAAANLAGLEVLQLVHATSASVLAYSYGKIKTGSIAVYDFGGGNISFSIIRIAEGVFNVVSTNGNSLLGGDDVDQRVIDYLVENFQADHQVDLRQDHQALQRLKEAVMKARIELSDTLQTELDLPYIAADASGPKHLVRTLTRAKLEKLTAGLVVRSLWPVRQALKDAGIPATHIDELVLVGGMSRMPAVQAALGQLFSREPHFGVRPDETTACGAAILAGMLSSEVKDIILLDVTPMTLSLETTGGVATKIIGRNTTIPVCKSFLFSTADPNQTSLEIHLLQGERPQASDNHSLGKLVVENIHRSSSGAPHIEINFEINASGILKVTAQDKSARRIQPITTRFLPG